MDGNSLYLFVSHIGRSSAEHQHSSPYIAASPLDNGVKPHKRRIKPIEIAAFHPTVKAHGFSRPYCIILDNIKGLSNIL